MTPGKGRRSRARPARSSTAAQPRRSSPRAPIAAVGLAIAASLLPWHFGALAAQEGPRLAAGSADAVRAARAYRRAHAAPILREFMELLAIPNVASDEANIRRNADWLVAALERRGIDARALDGLGGPPPVYGELPVPGATRTLVFYAHYDGQPVDTARWTYPPWQPVLLSGPVERGGRPVELEPDATSDAIDPDWRIYARGAGDDKAPVAAILAALDALREAGMAPTSNLKFFFEGEEEAGSAHLAEVLRANAELLAADGWLIMDGPVHQSRRPQLFFGVRGYTGLQITVYGANRYLHSGHYGNWAPNPALDLARLLASMKDERGHVLIEGFHDDTAPIGEEERAAIAAASPFDDRLRAELGLAATEADDAPYLERMLIPSLNVRGLQSGTTGPTARNVIPPSATASLDIRLAKGNDPERMLDLVEAHVRGRGYHVVLQDPDSTTRAAHPRIARIDRSPGYRAARVPLDAPLARDVIGAASEAAGEEPILAPTLGGSLPLYLFEEVLGTPAVGVPIANHDDNQHAPDENLRVGNLWYGIDLVAAIMTM
jgi:acetylornithine deacetylase/succinyl-diaminopimelate desuccinylase-like protein